jgi:competence protein ComEC
MYLKIVSAIAVGIISGAYIGAYEWEMARICLLACSLACLIAFRLPLIACFCISCTCSIMWYHVCLEAQLARTRQVIIDTVFHGYISAEPEPVEQRVWYVVTGSIDNEKISIRARADRYPQHDVGQFVQVEGTIEAAEPFETEGGIFDYPRFLYARGIHARADRVKVTPISAESFSPYTRTRSQISGAIFDFKHMLVRPVEEVLPPREGALVLGMVYGMKKGLSESDDAAFKTSGLSHLVVLSGSNVAIVAAFLKSFVSAFPAALSRYLGWFPVSGVWLLVLMAGAEPSGVRAGIMATVSSTLTNSRQDERNTAAKSSIDIVIDAFAGAHAWKKIATLSSVAACMAILNPLSVAHDPSYALSFLATFGVTFVAPVLSRLSILIPMPSFMREVLSQTVAAQICTLPVVLSMGGGQTILSPIANALAAPLVPLAMASGGAVSIVGLISKTTAEIPAVVAVLSTRAIYAVAAFFAVE